MEYLVYLVSMLVGAGGMFGYTRYQAKKAAPTKRKYVRKSKAKVPNAATTPSTKPTPSGVATSDVAKTP